MPSPDCLFDRFSHDLADGDAIGRLAAGLIGADAEFDGPFGRKTIVYADYVASGRSLMQIEQFILTEILPYYANSHTEASYCGGFVTRLRRQARAVIARECGADDRHAVIFTGSGATAGINRLVHLFGASPGPERFAGAGPRRDATANDRRPCVIIGPYEHHSNILAWRESGAEVVEIGEAAYGGPDLDALDAALRRYADRDPLIGAFSAASNVTGILTDVAAVTRRLKQAGALAVWDYAGAGPYLPIAMSPDGEASGAEIDAIVVSPHKFIGGPGASGVLIVRRDAVRAQRPTWPGGGTVRFVTSRSHLYSDSLEAREEAGTPNVIGDIRAALVFLVKAAIGPGFMSARNRALAERALATCADVPNLVVLGNRRAERLPIVSFRIAKDGGYVHHQLVTRLLSDRFGIQARGGCACAGPYVHRLLDIDDALSERLSADIVAGHEIAKPGFVRLNFSVLLPDDKVSFILEAVADLARDAATLERGYRADPRTAIFTPAHGRPVVAAAP